MLTDKCRSSRGAASPLTIKTAGWIAIFLLACTGAASAAINLSPADRLRIGKRIWQNECNGTVAGLTAWNSGENFASLGIGHFIWYPKGAGGPFEESFPKFLRFAGDKRTPLPARLQSYSVADPGGLDCPWNSRAEFYQANQSAQMKELRQFLAKTVDVQAAFMVERLEQALPKMLAAASPAERGNLRQRFDRVADSPMGCYALVDYVNFKGEGVLDTERYAGQGWGLLQVLEGMSQESTGKEAVKDFAESAKRVLTNRVRNSPPERHESRWLPGWLNRVQTYVQS